MRRRPTTTQTTTTAMRAPVERPSLSALGGLLGSTMEMVRLEKMVALRPRRPLAVGRCSQPASSATKSVCVGRALVSIQGIYMKNRKRGGKGRTVGQVAVLGVGLHAVETLAKGAAKVGAALVAAVAKGVAARAVGEVAGDGRLERPAGLARHARVGADATCTVGVSKDAVGKGILEVIFLCKSVPRWEII